MKALITICLLLAAIMIIGCSSSGNNKSQNNKNVIEGGQNSNIITSELKLKKVDFHYATNENDSLFKEMLELFKNKQQIDKTTISKLFNIKLIEEDDYSYQELKIEEAFYIGDFVVIYLNNYCSEHNSAKYEYSITTFTQNGNIIDSHRFRENIEWDHVSFESYLSYNNGSFTKKTVKTNWVIHGDGETSETETIYEHLRIDDKGFLK